MTRPVLRLVPMTSDYLADLGPVLSDVEVLRYTRFPSPPPADFAQQWLARYLAGRLAGTAEAFAAVAPAGEFLGLALVPELDAETSEAELGYLVTPAHRGRGVATELLRQLTSWAFDTAEIKRATLLIDVDNTASIRVAEHAGYRKEGTMRSVYFKQGLRGDVELWSRLPSD